MKETLDARGLPQAHWQRTLWAMLSVQFTVSCAFSVVPPVLPLILPSLGVSTPGAVRSWAGVLVGVTPLAAALMSPRWGRLADRIDRRLIILIACSTAAACTAAMSLASNPWELLGLRFTMGLFGGHVAAGLSIVGAATPTHRMGWALGWLATGQLAGALLGPLLGGAMADAFSSLRAPFLLAGIAALLVAAAVALVPAPAPSANHSADRTHATHTPLPREVRALVVVLLLAQCAIMMTQPVISLHVRELVGPRINLATLAGLAFSVVGLGGLLAAPLLGRLSDYVGARRLLLFVVVAAAVFVVPQAYTSTYGGFVAERFVAGLFLCSVIPIVNSLAGRTVQAEMRGRTFGATSGAAFLGAFIGPVAGGLLGARASLDSVFMASAVILSINAVFIGLTVWPGRRARGAAL